MIDDSTLARIEALATSLAESPAVMTERATVEWCRRYKRPHAELHTKTVIAMCEEIRMHRTKAEVAK